MPVTTCYNLLPARKAFFQKDDYIPLNSAHNGKKCVALNVNKTRDVKKGEIMVRILTIIALIAAFGLGSAMFVGCQHRGHQRGAEFMMDYMAEALDLNEEQKAMANLHKDEILAKVRAMHTEKKNMHDELKTQLSGDTIDTVRVKALVAEHRAGMDDVVNLVVDKVAEFHATLSPEQRTKLVAKLEKFEKRHQGEWKY